MHYQNFAPLYTITSYQSKPQKQIPYLELSFTQNKQKNPRTISMIQEKPDDSLKFSCEPFANFMDFESDGMFSSGTCERIQNSTPKKPLKALITSDEHELRSRLIKIQEKAKNNNLHNSIQRTLSYSQYLAQRYSAAKRSSNNVKLKTDFSFIKSPTILDMDSNEKPKLVVEIKEKKKEKQESSEEKYSSKEKDRAKETVVKKDMVSLSENRKTDKNISENKEKLKSELNRSEKCIKPALHKPKLNDAIARARVNSSFNGNSNKKISRPSRSGLKISSNPNFEKSKPNRKTIGTVVSINFNNASQDNRIERSVKKNSSESPKYSLDIDYEMLEKQYCLPSSTKANENYSIILKLHKEDRQNSSSHLNCPLSLQVQGNKLGLSMRKFIRTSESFNKAKRVSISSLP